MSTDWKEQTDSIVPLLDCIVENIPAPEQVGGYSSDADHFTLTILHIQAVML